MSTPTSDIELALGGFRVRDYHALSEAPSPRTEVALAALKLETRPASDDFPVVALRAAIMALYQMGHRGYDLFRCGPIFLVVARINAAEVAYAARAVHDAFEAQLRPGSGFTLSVSIVPVQNESRDLLAPARLAISRLG